MEASAKRKLPARIRRALPKKEKESAQEREFGLHTLIPKTTAPSKNLYKNLYKRTPAREPAFSWLLVLHGSGWADHREWREELGRLQRRMPADGFVYVVLFGPTKNSVARTLSITRDRVKLLKEAPTRDPKGMKRAARVRNVEALRKLLAPVERVDAVCVGAHSSGWVLGPWKGREPFLSGDDLNKEIFARYKPRLAVFDACMMGTMTALYPLRHVRWAVASPGLQPYFSYVRLPAFALSTSRRFSLSSKALAQRLAAEWNHVASRERDRCALVFDVHKVKRLAPLLKRHWARLKFDKRAQLHKKDANLFDLWAAARDVPSVRKALEAAVLAAKPLHDKKWCCYPCARSLSVSVEVRTPGKWQHIYRKNPWVRYLGRAKKHPLPRRAKTHPFLALPPNLRPRAKKPPLHSSTSLGGRPFQNGEW